MSAAARAVFMRPMPQCHLLDSRQLSELLGMARRTFVEYVSKQADFPAPAVNHSHRMRRWSLADVQAWADRNGWTITPTPNQVHAYAEGERAAERFLARLSRGETTAGELAACLGMALDPSSAGFCRRVERALQVYLRGLS